MKKFLIVLVVLFSVGCSNGLNEIKYDEHASTIAEATTFITNAAICAKLVSEGEITHAQSHCVVATNALNMMDERDWEKLKTCER